jgi:hypothetical protein
MAAEMRVDRHVIRDVLAVHDGRLLDLADGLVDVVDGVHFLGNDRLGGRVLEVSARIAQICKRMQVGGVVSGGVCPRGHGGDERDGGRGNEKSH